ELLGGGQQLPGVGHDLVGAGDGRHQLLLEVDEAEDGPATIENGHGRKVPSPTSHGHREGGAMAMLTAEEYRESLRRYRPRVFVDGEAVASVADEPRLAPGIAAIGVTYDYATRPEHAEVMTAKQAISGLTVNRLAHLNET